MAEERKVRVVMLPHLAYGHITPFFEFAKRLCDRGGFSIHICSSPINLSFIEKKFTDKYSSSIHLVELHLQDVPQLPPHYHTTNGLPPHLNPILFKEFKRVKPQLEQILKDQKADVFIYDTIQPWAAGVASALNIPAINFFCANVAQCCYFAHTHYRPGVEFPFPALYLTDYEREKAANSIKVEVEEEATEKAADTVEVEPEKETTEKAANVESGDMPIFLVNSSKAIDGKYLDYFSELAPTKTFHVGAQIQHDSGTNTEDAGDHMELFKWLGEKPEHSTVYVSFGSENFLSKEEREVMAYGLELSNVNFIWVLRFPKGEEAKLEEALPPGFLERIGDRGRVVERWAPQARILNHPSIGGFITHCGWNSTLESIEFGVPIIGMPMLYDQPLNARLVVEAGVAVEIPRDRKGMFHKGEIAEILKEVISEQKGVDLRRNMKALGENVRLLRDEEIDGVVEAIKELCEKRWSKNILA